MDAKKSLFERVGGRAVLARVHKAFYDKLYAHPVLKQFFAHKDQKEIEAQQTDFMTSNMGGGKIFTGKTPETCHQHLFVTREWLDLRNALLEESLRECGIPEDLAGKWMDIQKAFERAVVKKDVGECKKRFATDEIIVAKTPA
ncbi:MAG: group 1 truncated hemoglobin [Nitrospinae bacterium]|nr:group 1 truncated hemoglobin [Nitrospinota bacterium]